MMHDYETKSRLLAKLLRELLDSNRFENLADLADALKTRCAKLKIKYREDDVTAAMKMLASNRQIADTPKGLQPALTTKPLSVEGEIIPRAAASKIYDELMARYRSEHPKPEPKQSNDAPEHFPTLMPV
jgi:hypothetical protein